MPAPSGMPDRTGVRVFRGMALLFLLTPMFVPTQAPAFASGRWAEDVTAARHFPSCTAKHPDLRETAAWEDGEIHTITCRAGRSSIPPAGVGKDSARRQPERLRLPRETVWTGLRRILLPRELSLVYDLRALITAQQPLAPRTRQADLRRLDAIYVHAVYLAEGDIALTLFALAVATLPYHTFPARIPLLGWSVTVPVSTESREDFSRRLANLPGLLLADSPPQLDRDKLPHFFGSAWLHCTLRDEELTMAAGELIEIGEEVFKLEGFRDERDLVANRLGASFADALMRQRRVLPSDIFMNEH